MPLSRSTRLLFIDTLPILHLLEFHPEYYPLLSRLLDRVYEQRIQMVVSSVTLMEISVQAFRKGSPVLAQQYREFFTRSSHLYLREVDDAIAMEAARLQAAFSMGSNESLLLGTAHACGADLLLTGNSRWREWTQSEILTLEELSE